MFALGCGELAAEPPPPNAYAVAYPNAALGIEIWHSSGTTTTATQANGDACFTHDGAMLFGENRGMVTGNGEAPQLVVARRGDASEIVPIPNLAHWGVRSDGERLSWINWQDDSLHTYDRATNALGPVIAQHVEGRALYAGDDETLVFVRYLVDHDELVAMHDDGTHEEIVASGPIRDPSFSWDGRQIVFAQLRATDSPSWCCAADIVIADRATHALTTVATIDRNVWDPFLTPDGTAVIFISQQPGDWYSIMRLDLATSVVEMLAKNVIAPNEADSPSVHISVAPDAL